MPLFVLRIAVDGPAAADGRLRVGDQVSKSLESILRKYPRHVPFNSIWKIFFLYDKVCWLPYQKYSIFIIIFDLSATQHKKLRLEVLGTQV